MDDDSKVETSDYVLKAQGLKEEGNKLFQKRDYDGAMFKYNEAIKILPKDHIEVSNIRANIASCYMQLEPGEFTKAIHECDLALSITPDHSKALLKRARCYEALNKLDLALKDVCMVTKLDPRNPMAFEISENVTRTLESKGLRVNDSVIELSPDYVEPSLAMWAARGKTRVKKNRKSNQVEEKSEGEGNQVQEKSEGEDVETEKKNRKSSQVREKSEGEDVETEKKNRKSSQVREKSEGEDAETEKKKKNNSVAVDKGKGKIIDKRSKKMVKGKKSDKRSDTSKEEEKLLDTSDEDVKKTVKLVYSDDIRMAKLPINCSLFQLREVVNEIFASLRAVHIKYKDQEGDLVTITTDEELREVFARSLDTMRLYVVEVSPEQDPFFGRLAEMKKRVTVDSFKTKVNGKGIEEWMIEFAQLFKIQARVDSDTFLNLQELNSEAMEEVVTSDAAQGAFDRAAQRFQVAAARSLLKLGNVHMSGARKKLRLLRGISGEFVSEQVKTAYEYAQKEHGKAKEKYEEAMKIKPDLFEVFLALGLLQFEEARVSWYYVLVSHIDLKTWSYATVVELYQSAVSNIKKSLEGLKNLETKKERPGSSTQAEEPGKLKSWLDALLGAILYERSIMEYKLDQPLWRESLEAAKEKYELAGTCRDIDVAGNTLQDLRFHMEEIIQIFNEIHEAKQWRNGIPSDQLEEILKRRAEGIFHVSVIQRG